MKKAIICDIDGTLALLGGRDPFNPRTVEDDSINTPIANILEVYSHQTLHKITLFLITGRFEKYRTQTESWLRKHNITRYKLFMREDNDVRKDIDFKKDVYLMNIKDRYDVLFVLEDRDRVVDMWRRDLHLTCLQVDYGDF